MATVTNAFKPKNGLTLVNTADTATAATHYMVEIATDGLVRPKTLANTRTEIVTTAAVNAALATSVGTIGTGVWQGTAIGATYIDAAIARLASPTFTGTPTLPTGTIATTQAVDTNTTAVATTAYVIAQGEASVVPLINGTAATGSSWKLSKRDHVHPTDTTRAALASPTFTGTPVLPTFKVDSTSTSVGMGIWNAAGFYGGIGTDHWARASGTSTDIAIKADTSRAIRFFTNGTNERASIDSSGNFTVAAGQTILPGASAGTPSITTSGDTHTGIFFPAGDTVAVSTGGSERLRIDSSGRLGIGTTSPLNTLAVNGSMTLNPYYATYLANAYYDGAWKYVGNDIAWGIGNNFSGVADGVTIGVAANNASGAGAALTWIPAFNIDSTGLVGIGVTAPSAKLHVSGNTWLNNGSGDSGMRSQVATMSFAPSGNFSVGVDPGDTLRNTALIAKGATRPVVFTMRNVDNASAFWDFIVDGSSNKFYLSRPSITPAITIDTSNNVGIAKTSPTTALDVTGTVTATLFSGSGASLTALPAAQLSGAIPSAVTATTQTAGDNSTKIATTAYVASAIIGGADPGNPVNQPFFLAGM